MYTSLVNEKCSIQLQGIPKKFSFTTLVPIAFLYIGTLAPESYDAEDWLSSASCTKSLEIKSFFLKFTLVWFSEDQHRGRFSYTDQTSTIVTETKAICLSRDSSYISP